MESSTHCHFHTDRNSEYSSHHCCRSDNLFLRTSSQSCYKKGRGFTLIELSVVVMIMALLAGSALRYAASVAYANNVNATNTTLDAIEAALINFRTANNRLPCPTDLTLQENSSTFGLEAGAANSLVGYGECVAQISGTTPSPDANYSNALSSGNTTDPDGAPTYAAGVTADPYCSSTKADPQFDPLSVGEIDGGGVPTKTLKLPDRYAYDAWGHKIVYVVDKRMTAINAFTIYPASNPENMGSGGACYTPSGSCPSGDTCTAGAIVIKQNYNDQLSSAITVSALYALVSFGKDGHGGYVRNLNATSKVYNGGSNNPDELNNCHCTNNGTAGVFNRIFVQKPINSSNSSNLSDTFSDIVRYRTRTQIDSAQEMK